jgi:predicted patatin/cPLA2 family phospholipase
LEKVIYLKTGLVLEGGAMRGMYTAGVLDVLYEKGVHFDGIMGVSAGAAFGPNFLSGQTGRVIRYNRKYIGDKQYQGLGCLIKTGNLFSADFAYGQVPRELDVFDDEKFMASGVPFYAVVTNLDSGEPEYLQVESVFKDMDIIRASASLPFVSVPVEIKGQRYLDGGVADSVPYKAMEKLGYEKQVVVLTRDMDYRKKPMASGAIKLYYRHHPQFRDKLLQRHQVYNDSVAELCRLEREGKIFVIRPSRPIEIGRVETDGEKLQEVYELGRQDGEAVVEKLKEYMEI